MGGFENYTVWLSEAGAAIVALVACALVVWSNHGLSLSPVRSILRTRVRSASAAAAAAGRSIGLAGSRAPAGRSAVRPARRAFGAR